jgi:hypothetical protein
VRAIVAADLLAAIAAVGSARCRSTAVAGSRGTAVLRGWGTASFCSRCTASGFVTTGTRVPARLGAALGNADGARLAARHGGTARRRSTAAFGGWGTAIFRSWGTSGGTAFRATCRSTGFGSTAILGSTLVAARRLAALTLVVEHFATGRSADDRLATDLRTF